MHVFLFINNILLFTSKRMYVFDYRDSINYIIDLIIKLIYHVL